MTLDGKKNEFLTLYGEFVREYLSQARGQEHLRRYDEGRAQGRRNFEEVKEDANRAGVPTEKVLRMLLPHTDSAAHRNAGAWIHIAPVIQGEIRTWFEAAGWTQPEDWPKVANAILSFLTRCDENPSALETACHDFVSSPHTTGFQTGMLTPMLNALRPDDFMIINNKSRRVINYLAGTSFKQRLSDYPAVNAAGRRLVEQQQGCMRQVSPSAARPADLFDMFCHWLVAEKKFVPVYTREGRARVAGGETTVVVPDDDDGVTREAAALVRESHKVQAALAEIGAKMGFQIWIPRNDRSKVLEHCSGVHNALLDELPLNYIDVTLKTIEQIDVIWIKKQSIARAFEVEHTTAIYSGLLRMADLLSLQPDINIRLHIVAPDEKHDKVMREIKRPIFSSLEKAPLYQRCSFISYSSVAELRKLPHLEFMSDSVLKEYEEFAEEE